MADSTIELCDGEITQKRMRSFFGTLSEKDQRRYAALEAQRRGHGGMKSVSEMFGCSTKTISRGMDELDTLDEDPTAGRRVFVSAAVETTISRRTVK
jgi:Trp operon repressor